MKFAIILLESRAVEDGGDLLAHAYDQLGEIEDALKNSLPLEERFQAFNDVYQDHGMPFITFVSFNGTAQELGQSLSLDKATYLNHLIIPLENYAGRVPPGMYNWLTKKTS